MSSEKQPRLLSLNSYHYKRGGSDAVYFEHDALFRAKGWDTGFFSMHHPSNESTPWDKYFVDEIEFGSDYGVVDKLKMAGKIIYSTEANAKLQTLIDNWRPDVAHAHCIYHHLSPSVLRLLKSNGIPTVMTAHDLKLACPAYKMLNSNGICEKCKGGNLLHVAKNRCLHGSLVVSSLVMIESMVHKSLRLYKNNLDKIVVPSRFFGEKLQEWGWDANQLVYIPNYVDASAYEPVYEPGEYLLYFGRLAPEKGLATLLRANATAGTTLKLVGTGPEEENLKQLAAEVGGNVEFLGFCNKETLWPIVKGSRAVVLPSEWYENAPMSLLEANGLGKIVVGARIGGIPEMIEHDSTGYLFESGNQEQLAEVLSQLKTMPDSKLMTMGRAARANVAENFTIERYAAAMEELYASLGVATALPAAS
ncbi:glycosyltransferase family 4 protein [Halioxenophilus aromaticivorans]|uniref:Glycosyltransferase family 4 protein n=1 Tax=Halioxenophilus aromaticivorans TaxID=1306992 RepID=A0AAV3U1H3_9ALTE